MTGPDTAEAARSFNAPDVVTLADSPLLIVLIRNWHFSVGGVPLQISYPGGAGGQAFDTTVFVRNVERLWLIPPHHKSISHAARG